MERWENEQNNSEMMIYTTEDGLTKIETTFDGDTVWLSIDQMAELFQRDKSTISRHIKNIFAEGELERDSVVAKFATTECSYYFYLTDPEIAQIGYYPRFIHSFPLSNFLPLLFQSSNYSYWQE